MVLKNKVAIVTGSGRSIGRVLALGLAEQGANIVVVARDKKEIEQIKKEIIKKGVKSIAIKADLTKENEVKNMVEKALKKFEKIDILVNNAGLITDRILSEKERKIIDIPLSKFKKIIDHNLITTFLCSREVGKFMKSQKSGKIINISSKLAKNPLANFGAYSSVKAGVEILTKVLALELKEYNIQVNALYPSNSVNILQREFGNPLVKRVLPEELISPLLKLCNSKVTGKSIEA